MSLSAGPRSPAGVTSMRSRPSQSRICLQFFMELCGGFGWGAGLRIGGMDAQDACRAVGLEVDARDDPVAEQEGQDVVAILALFGRRVDLDAVAETEQAFGAGAFEHQRIERRQQRAGVDLARDAGRGVEVGLLVPALDADGNQFARSRPVLRAGPSCRLARGGNSRAGTTPSPRHGHGRRFAAVRDGHPPGQGRGRSYMAAGSTRSGRS